MQLINFVHSYNQNFYNFMELKTKTQSINKFVMPATYAISAAAAMTLNSPFSVLRFRLQTMPELLRQGILNKPYLGLSDCAKRIFKEQTIKGFWKGNLSALLRFYPAECLNFLLKNHFQKVYRNKQFLKDQSKFAINFLGGITSGFITLTTLYPLDYARLKMANDISGKNRGIFNCISETYKLEGLKGIYRGVGVTYISMIIYRGLFFGTYDTVKTHTTNIYQRFCVGYVSAVLAVTLNYPLDTVRRRLMMTSGHSFKYKGFLDCFRTIYKNQRFGGLFRGYPLILIQAVLLGVMFTSFDNLFRHFQVNLQDIPV